MKLNKGDTVLVTGGAGYIGSHITLSLLDSGHEVIVVDRDDTACKHLQKCLSRRKKLKVYNADISNDVYMDGIMTNNDVKAVVHCAADISVPESMDNPLKYYENNVGKTLILLERMRKHNINLFVFSSSAAVYGTTKEADILELTEQTPCRPISPYGESKLMIETILRKHSLRNPNFRYVSFRFFNVAGNDIGNKIQDVRWRKKHNLVPKLFASVIDEKNDFEVYGTNYDTKDGSCVRDYVHPYDIASAHTTALKDEKVAGVYNLGSSKGSSVWDVVKAAVSITEFEMEILNGRARKGDPPILLADSTKFREATGWEPIYSLDEIVMTAYKAYKKVK
mgnify:FL=1